MRNENLNRRKFMISDGEHFYPMKFMVDTGANVTVISKLSYDSVRPPAPEVIPRKDVGRRQASIPAGCRDL